jgi:cytochrome c oxidase subunit 1
MVVGAIMAMVPVALGCASTLYTFYPPLIGSALFYIGLVLVIIGFLDRGRADDDAR